ncbi:MAG: hypothetical protein WCT31_02020 [Candidatus Micrarchaeia archaeon]|jgi:hypothetical protein
MGGDIPVSSNFLAAIAAAKLRVPVYKEGKVEILRLGKFGAPSGLEKQYSTHKIVYTAGDDRVKSGFMVIETPRTEAGIPGTLSLIEPISGLKEVVHAIARLRVFIFKIDVVQAMKSNPELAKFVREHGADFFGNSNPQ